MARIGEICQCLITEINLIVSVSKNLAVKEAFISQVTSWAFNIFLVEAASWIQEPHLCFGSRTKILTLCFQAKTMLFFILNMNGHFIGKVKDKAVEPYSGSWCILRNSVIKCCWWKSRGWNHLLGVLHIKPLVLVTAYQRHRTQAGEFFTSKQHPFEKVVDQ